MKVQEMFDQVVTHLMKQGHRALRNEKDIPAWSSGQCAYLADNGDKCAAGCLIPPDKYSKRMEGEPIAAVAFFQELASGSDNPDKFIMLLAKLQGIHDHAPVESWSKLLTEVGQYHGLSIPDVLKGLNHEDQLA